MVDTLALGASAFGCEGSSPSLGTKIQQIKVMPEHFDSTKYENLLRQYQEQTISNENLPILNALITLSLKYPEIVEPINDKLAKEYGEKNQ
jgi:hypothetical protein